MFRSLVERKQREDFVGSMEGLRDWFSRAKVNTCPKESIFTEMMHLMGKIADETVKLKSLPIDMTTNEAVTKATSSMEAIAHTLDLTHGRYTALKAKLSQEVPVDSSGWTDENVKTLTAQLHSLHKLSIDQLRAMAPFAEKAAAKYDQGTRDVEIALSDYVERLIKNINRSIREVEDAHTFLSGILEKVRENL